MSTENSNQVEKIKTGLSPVGAVLVVGGGIAGIQASLDLAESGFKVYLVESSPAIGGTMAQLDKTFPTNDCSMCILSPKLVECGRHLNIEILANAEVTGIEGIPGNMTVFIKTKPRYIDVNKCTGCGDCADKCPVEVFDQFNADLAKRKAIYKLYPQAIPNAFIIEKKGMAPCRDACPAGVNAQGYVALTAQGRFEEALELVRKTIPFPAVCGRICTHPCEQACNRQEIDKSIAIASLKRFLADYQFQKTGPKLSSQEKRPEKLKETKIAVVGSGPAGLTAARDLALMGYPVTVFEALPVSGGMLRVGVPEYRLPKDILQKEIDLIVDLGVEIQTNTPLGADFTVDDIFKKGYKAVFLAVGAHKSGKMGIEGEELEGVLGGTSFLKDVNLGEINELSGKVAVIGGGNTAIDAARSAKRLGAEEVSIIYRRSRSEMPASEEEIEAAEEEGILIKYLACPIRILGKNGKVSGTECVGMKLGEPDESGRQRPVPIEGSEFTVDADFVIMAVSQSPDTSFLPDEKFKKDKRGLIKVDNDTLMTSCEGVFAGGDAISGPASAIEAMAAGKIAALSIDAFIKDESLKTGIKPEELEVVELTEEEIIEAGYERKERVKMLAASVDERVTDFSEVELGFTEEMSIEEAKRCLNCGICSECLQCEAVCQAKAINHFSKEGLQELNVGAVILAPGFRSYDPKESEEYGFGRYPNVVSGIQFERILSASGPFKGHVKRPSDGEVPKKIAFLQCIGSRDKDHNYCSSICCMSATKEAIIAKDHMSEVDCSIFIMDMRAFGKGFDDYYERAKEQYGIKYVRSRISSIIEDPSSKNLILKYQSEDGEIKYEEFDLVVLSAGVEVSESVKKLASDIEIELDENNFCLTKEFKPIETSRPGIFVCGPFSEPKDIPESVTQASGAAAGAMELLSDSRGTLTEERKYPQERDIVSEEPRIGVFICHCGSNIAGVIDVEEVEKFASDLPGVVHSERMLYTCSDDSQDLIKEKIEEFNLNRVIVASCTPRTHAPLFQETMRQGKLNPYLFEMANIRDQCSWIHGKQPDAATKKAKDLVKMAVSKSRLLEPLYESTLPLIQEALVIGGGVAGMTVANSLSSQGFKVYLIEKEDNLGGNLRSIHYTIQGIDPQRFLKEIVGQVEKDSNIEVIKNAQLEKSSGFIGNFVSIIAVKEDNEVKHKEIKHGVTIVATGGLEYRGDQYLLGEDARVITQHDLEERITSNPQAITGINNIAMIQCVVPPEQDFYCSRFCCTKAIKNALKIKELNPAAQIAIFYRDIRTFGFREKYFSEALKKGIIFVRFNDDQYPRVERVNNGLEVTLKDPSIGKDLVFKPDLLALSTAVVPSEANKQLSNILKVPLSKEGFFLEAHVKLRPVDFASDGIFLCGLAHYPKFLEESVTQAKAAAARAATILSQKELRVGGVAARVDQEKCVACLTCVRACPYEAPHIISEGVAEIELAKCRGCGICVSECPAKAIDLLNYRDRQIICKTGALFNEVSK